MRCIVVGNSPSVQNSGVLIDGHDVVIRTGVPAHVGNSQDLGTRTDVLVTRRKKYFKLPEDYIQTFNNTVTIDDNKNINETPDVIYIMHNMNNFTIPDNLLEHVDNMGGLKSNEKPTLGFIAVCMSILLYDRVSICGIEMDYNSRYISKGHYGDIEYSRMNNVHCLYKEMLTYNKHMRSGILDVV